MDKGGYVYQRYVPFPIRNGVTKIGRNLNYFYKKAYKVLDKWTATPAKGESTTPWAKYLTERGSAVRCLPRCPSAKSSVDAAPSFSS